MTRPPFELHGKTTHALISLISLARAPFYPKSKLQETSLRECNTFGIRSLPGDAPQYPSRTPGHPSPRFLRISHLTHLARSVARVEITRNIAPPGPSRPREFKLRGRGRRFTSLLLYELFSSPLTLIHPGRRGLKTLYRMGTGPCFMLHSMKPSARRRASSRGLLPEYSYGVGTWEPDVTENAKG